MGWVRIHDGATGEIAALLVLVAFVLNGCSYSKDEPGLFGRSPEPTTVAPPTVEEESTPPVPRTNPDLPVVGDAVWTSGEGLDIQVRIAVHAVRRIPGATVLDWSVTPLRGPGLKVGDAVPGSVNLGLYTFGEDNMNAFLVDALAGKVYRPLTSRGYPGWHSCLCSPVRVAELSLRIGETRLMQIAYPELPPDVATIDVDLATVPIFSHVPVTGIGLVPEATSPTDLTRSPEMLPIASSSAPFRYGRGKQLFVISIDNVTAGSTFVSVQWTVQSLTAGEGVELAQSPPFAEVAPGSAKVYNPSSASGPQVRPAGTGLATLRAQLMSSKREGLGAVECLCTDFGVWAASLQQAQQQVSVVTNLPPLPNDTQQVDVVLPGLTTLRRVPVTSATDATLRSAGPVPKRIRTWTYNSGYPPAGWSVDQWPTPVPNSRQLSRYEATVDDLVR